MKYIFVLMLMIPSLSFGSFILNYDLNYSSETESSDTEYEKTRTFHKVFLGGSINGKKTLFLGWNINSWTSTITYGSNEEDKYSLQEMGPKILWFFNDNYNWHLGLEWNPYATGTRTKAGVDSDIDGSSTNFSIGYRFKISNSLGLGAGLHYHTLSLKEETINDTSSTSSDKVTNIMPVLELSFILK